MSELYRIYIDEILTVSWLGKQLLVNQKKSRHPVCRGKHQTFEHLITRESKHSGKRNFDRDRANRIHWIRPIIENYEDARIKYFEEFNNKKQLQYFLYFEDKNFIVIIRNLPNGNRLITSYYVDQGRKLAYRRKYNDYINKKTPLRE